MVASRHCLRRSSPLPPERRIARYEGDDTMHAQPWQATARYLRRVGITAALLTVSLAPHGSAHAVPDTIAAAAPTGAPYTLSLSGLRRSEDPSMPDLLG